MDNSPCTVVECLYRRTPFLTTNVGGIAELIREHDELAGPTAHELAAKLEHVLQHGHRPYTPTCSQTEAARDLVALHQDMHDSAVARAGRAPSIPAAGAKPAPLVSVCLLHRDRPGGLRRALEGFASQTYANFEVIVADNGSSSPPARTYLAEIEVSSPFAFPIKVVRMGYNAFPGPARNAAVRLARGEILKFHDDDNISKPNELEVLAGAIERGFDLVTCGLDFFEAVTDSGPRPSDRQLMFMGDGGGLTLLRNVVGDTNLAIRKSAFLEIGGFDDIGYLYEAEDWHFLAKAQTGGLKIGTIPEALVWYRVDAEGDRRNWRRQDVDGIRSRIASTLAQGMPSYVGGLLDYLAGRSEGGSARSGLDQAIDLADRRWVMAQLASNNCLPSRTSPYSLAGVRQRLFNNAPSLEAVGWDELIPTLKAVGISIPDDFDEERYLADNIDVADAVREGRFKSGYMHYLCYGRLEHRGRPTK